MQNQGRTIAILAHITVVGWIIAIILNSTERSEFGSFYIRQLLGLYLLGIVGYWIPIVGMFTGIVVFILLIYSLIEALNDRKTPTPLIGNFFQDLFKGL